MENLYVASSPLKTEGLIHCRTLRYQVTHKYFLPEAIPKMKLFANYFSIPEWKPTGYFHCNECTILEINMKAMALCMKNNCNHFDNFNNRLFSVQSRKKFEFHFPKQREDILQ